MKLFWKIAVAFLSLTALQANAWWSDDWSFRKELKVDTSGINPQIKKVPVLLRLSAGNFGFFYDVLPKGEDLRFMMGDDKTPLKYHVEKFDQVAEMALVWVQVPVSASPAEQQTVYMYYGNPAAVDGSDPGGTYDVSQALVYHFSDLAKQPSDSTAYGNHPISFQGEVNALGLIGNAAKLASNQGIQSAASSSLRYIPGVGATVSAWVQSQGQQTTGAQIFRWGDASQFVAVDMNGPVPRLSVQTPSGQKLEASASLALNVQSWHHIGVLVEASQASLYVDGAMAAQLPVALTEFGPSLTVGAGGGAMGAAMMVDEVKISNTARGGEWFKKIVDNQAVGSDIVVYGGDESADSGGQSNYFIGILSSVSLDGWVVIGLLGVLAAISWLVVIAKSIVISSVVKDNRLFLQKFQKLNDEITELDREQSEEEQKLEDAPLLSALFGKHDHFQSSNLYRLYHIAMQNLEPRIGKSVGASAVLSPEGLAVVKAALDAAMMREQQKLNKLMVLLTIAISGGPFLGLLGTVLGVMITFAAIAISGDVDIGAIAPGVSAALMTTVAGLFVAIPALFSYNYLSTRIRDLSIDMRVFCDELVAKIAEYHR